MELIKWRVEDYHQMIEAGILSDRPVELLEGNIFTMSPEKPLHSDTTETLAEYLRKKLAGKAKVREAHPVTLANSEPEPDLAVVIDKRYSESHPVPKDIFWLIEISNTTLGMDKNQKKKIYATAGIMEYWVIDLNARELIIFREPRGENYQTELKITEGKLRAIAFLEIELDVTEILPNKSRKNRSD